MSKYLLTVLGSVLICAFITAILPDGKTSSTVKGVTKTVCLLVIISPVLSFLQKTGKDAQKTNVNFQESVIESDEDFIKYYSELRVRNTEQLLQSELLQRFAAHTNVSLDWNSKTEEEKKIMSAYLTEHYCSEVLIE